MFELIESDRREREEPGWTGRIVSALIHIFLLSMAIAATRGVVEAVGEERPHPIDPTWPEPGPRLPGPDGAPISSPIQPPSVPVNISTTIPDPGPALPPGVLVTVNPDPGIMGADTSRGIPGPNTSGTHGLTFDVRQVDEQPELLSHPTLRYPDVLRRAGIEGRVMVEVVLDSLGRAEPGSARVASSSHQLFDPEAVAVVSGSVYRPARVSGRAVRVRVRVPVSFTLRT